MEGDLEEEKKVREATGKGKAFAGKKFIDYWENKIECCLRNLKPGPRPKK
jgi:hypothetical protein